MILLVPSGDCQKESSGRRAKVTRIGNAIRLIRVLISNVWG